jgi:hypothetical protein
MKSFQKNALFSNLDFYYELRRVMIDAQEILYLGKVNH